MWRNKKIFHNCQDFTILHIFHVEKSEIQLHFSDFFPFAMYRNLKILHMTDLSPHVSHVNFVTNMRYDSCCPVYSLGWTQKLNSPNNADTRPRFQTRHLHREPAWPSPPTQPPRQRVARWEKDELSLRPVEVLTFPLAVDIKTELWKYIGIRDASRERRWSGEASNAAVQRLPLSGRGKNIF